MNMQEIFQENLNQAVRHLQIADHIAYVTYPLINEKRLLIKILEEIYLSIINCINAVLIYEKEDKENIGIFIKKYSKDYRLSNEHIKNILEILETNQKHKESTMEFIKKEKLIILSNTSGIKTIDISVIKSYLLTAKELLLKINLKIKPNKN